MAKVNFLLLVMLITFIILCASSEKAEDSSEKWKRKDIRDYTDADVERLYEQWEVSWWFLFQAEIVLGANELRNPSVEQ